MRPEILNPLFAPVTTLKGAGPKIAAAAARLFGRPEKQPARLIDLLLHLPHDVIDRHHRPALNALPKESGQIVTIRARVARHRSPPPNSPAPHRIEVCDDTGCVTLVYFHARGSWLQQLLPEGETRYISGRLEWYGGKPQIVHPDHVLTEEEFTALPELEPVYPATHGLASRTLGKLIRQALEHLPELPEWLDPALIKQRGWPTFREALLRVHRPETPADLAPDSPARQRLAFDELLANQLALALVRHHVKGRGGRALCGDGRLRERILAALPYTLTGAQERAVAEIIADMESDARMLRLLQGDVGSGKTVVALLAMAHAAEAGAQSALMAPSDLLARQHFATVAPLAEAAGLRAVLLTGREKGKKRKDLLAQIESGQAHIVIGTHALFQQDVAFADLGLVVVDEQHRFGVHQRLALQRKARHAADVLVMSATPIPRTLALALYGDMDISRLDEKPPGRQPVRTATIPIERLGEVIARLVQAVERGERAYWICPVVEESDTLPATSAEERFATLMQAMPGKVGLAHGRMKGEARDAVMEQFRRGEIAVLVATTVVEVGVDVPEASIIIIENAERFGLAQLHQLRGRVGRGNKPSSCVLLYRDPLTATARERLKVMRETEDGFVIAEADLKLRGAGDLLGAKQSGLPQFRTADLSQHDELLAIARDDARRIILQDPDLRMPRGEALRHLLYLHERDAAVPLLTAG